MDSETGSATSSAVAAGAAAAPLGPWGIGIAAGATLISGLMGAKARRESEERQRKLQLEMAGLETQKQAAQSMTQGQQNAFNTMMQGYGSALRG